MMLRSKKMPICPKTQISNNQIKKCRLKSKKLTCFDADL